MTLVFIEKAFDTVGREWWIWHAPSRSTPGIEVWKVENLVGTDVWLCSCPAFKTYKKPCTHVPNGVVPPRLGVASTTPSLRGASTLSEEDLRTDTSERILTLEEKIEDLASRDSTFKRLCLERKSGAIVVHLLHEFHGFRIQVPRQGTSIEDYLATLPQFSTIRTVSGDVVRKHQERGDEGWEEPVKGEQKARQRAYATHYAKQKGQTHLFVGSHG